MALIVETGSGEDPTVNSYISVADAGDLLTRTNRKNGVWADGGAAVQEAALALAFMYMYSRWTDKWLGIASKKDQPGDWPRRDTFKRSGHAYRSTEIPTVVIQAQVEYALIEATTPGILFTSPEYDDTGRVVIEKTDKVDVLVETRKFSDRTQPVTWRKYPIADNLLKHLIESGSVSTMLRQ